MLDITADKTLDLGDLIAPAEQFRCPTGSTPLASAIF
jgi:hypothetical protein